VALRPVTKGLLLALGSVALAALGIGLAFSTLPAAAPSLFQGIALVGASLVLAYAVEATLLTPRVEVGDGHEEWLGFVVGAGLAGFGGVVLALLLAQHRDAGHDNFLDDLGLAWCAVSLITLGATILVQPLLAERLRHAGSERPGSAG
jgi:hypothetical protein